MLHPLLSNRNDNNQMKFKTGIIKEAAEHFECSTRTVARLWKRYVTTVDQFGVGGDVSSRLYNSRRRSLGLVADLFKIPVEDRQTLRDLSWATDMSGTTLHRIVKEGVIAHCTSHLLPFLTHDQMMGRVKFVMDCIKPNGMFDDICMITSMSMKNFSTQSLSVRATT